MTRNALPCLIPVMAASIAVMGACGPSQEELDAERAKVRDLQGQLQEAEQQSQALEDRLQDIKAQNQELSSRLAALGQNLEEVQGDRQSLKESLEETRTALEQLRERQEQAQERLQTFRDLLEKFRSMIESGKLRVRIVRNRMVVELPEGVLFDSGKAKLKDGGESTLAQVAPILREIEERDFQIAGHTDNVPIRTPRFPSNWELSTRRAVAVARHLIEQGMSAKRLSAAGYADTEPVASNDTEEGRAQNRRIEIVLVPALDELPDLSSLQEEAED
ncbi:MAG: OmpA family protein [Myxococcota bacterium]